MLCIYIGPSYSLPICVQCVAEVFNSSSAWRSNRSVIMGSSLFLVGHQYCFEIMGSSLFLVGHQYCFEIMGSSLFLVGHQYCFEMWNTDCGKVMLLLIVIHHNCCCETQDTDCGKVMRRTLFIVYCHCWYVTWHADYINVMRVILYHCTPLLIQYVTYRPHKDIDVPSLSSLMRCDTQITSRSWALSFLVYYHVLSVKFGVATPMRCLTL